MARTSKGGRQAIDSKEETIGREKLKQVYLDCLALMKDGKPCERVSEKEGGLDECEPFGKKPWDTYDWTEREREKVQNNVGKNQYDKTLACLKNKTKKILDNSQSKRVRMKPVDPEPSGGFKPRPAKTSAKTSARRSGKSKP
jgi:hypothetical protein